MCFCSRNAHRSRSFVFQCLNHSFGNLRTRRHDNERVYSSRISYSFLKILPQMPSTEFATKNNDTQQSTTHKLSPRKFMLRWLGRFCFANAIILCLIGLRYLPSSTLLLPGNMPLGSNIVLAIFLGATYLGILGLLAAIPCLLVTLPFVAVWPKRWLISVLAVLASSTITLFLIIDTVVYKQYHFHLNGIIYTCFFLAQDMRFLIFPGSSGLLPAVFWAEYAFLKLLSPSFYGSA